MFGGRSDKLLKHHLLHYMELEYEGKYCRYSYCLVPWGFFVWLIIYFLYLVDHLFLLVVARVLNLNVKIIIKILSFSLPFW